MKNVIHVISMQRGLGGVQQSFLSYYKFAQKTQDINNIYLVIMKYLKIMVTLKIFLKYKRIFFLF